MIIRKIRYFLILLIWTVPSIISTEYGPSVLSLVRPSLDPSFMTPFEQTHYVHRLLRLEMFHNYATVLPLADGRTWIKSEEIIDILGKEYLHDAVPFMVVPPADHGIMVVIQELQIPAAKTFNQSLIVIDDNGSIVDCFSKFVFQIEGKSPVHVCGQTDAQDKYKPGALDGVGPRSIIVPLGKSIIIGFTYRDEKIDKSEALSKQVPSYDVGYLFHGKIAITAYKGCPHGPPFYDENNEKLWPCDIPSNSHDPVGTCIPEKLFCDKVINCGIHDSHEFAVDERFCKDEVYLGLNESNHFPSNFSVKGNNLVLDVPLLEGAIRDRVFTKERPYYNDVIVQWARPPQTPHIPGKGNGGNNFFPSEIQEKDQVSHPAFVALVILISIICVIVIGLMFRYCCKSCVGRMDPLGDSSNPDAVARFRENLRTRDEVGSRTRVNGGYGISIDSLFKPVDELPPSYEDLFPQDLETENRNKIQDNIISSSQSSSNMTGIVFTRRSSQIPNQSSASSPPIYTIPIVAQQLQSSPHLLLDRTTSIASNSSENNVDHCVINPAFVRVEVLSSHMSRRNGNDGRRESDQSFSDNESRRESNPNNSWADP